MAAPEMDGVADELFKIITDAGMQCGMTVRPQNLTINPNWKPSQRPNQSPFKYMQQVHIYVGDQRSPLMS